MLVSTHAHTTESPKDFLQVLPPSFNLGLVISVNENVDILKFCKSYQTQEELARGTAVIYDDDDKDICILYDRVI